MDFSPYFEGFWDILTVGAWQQVVPHAHLPHILRASRQMTAAARHNAACRRVFCALDIFGGTVEPLLYDHPRNHIGVVV